MLKEEKLEIQKNFPIYFHRYLKRLDRLCKHNVVCGYFIDFHFEFYGQDKTKRLHINISINPSCIIRVLNFERKPVMSKVT